MVAARHLLGLEPLGAAEIGRLLDRAAVLKAAIGTPEGAAHTLRGQLVANLFFEPSTRTRSSFEIAARCLGAQVLNWTVAGSSASKGETFLDTARNLAAMRPAALVVRHAAAGAPQLLAARLDCPIVNAGDGAHEHPSQGLLDAFTLRERWGDLVGRTVAIVGDIARSRVARSNLHCLPKLGARVRLCGPPTMLPRELAAIAPGVELCSKLEDAIRGADAVMLLRIQLERQEKGEAPLFPSLAEYSRLYGLGARSAAFLAPDALILHPGPVNRGVELSAELADGPRSVILDQVENGVAVRMAILEGLIVGAVGLREGARA